MEQVKLLPVQQVSSTNSTFKILPTLDWCIELFLKISLSNRHINSYRQENDPLSNDSWREELGRFIKKFTGQLDYIISIC